MFQFTIKRSYLRDLNLEADVRRRNIVDISVS